MDILLERVEIKQREHFAASVVRPERRDHLLLYRASVTARNKNTWFHIIEKEIFYYYYYYYYLYCCYYYYYCTFVLSLFKAQKL